MQPVWFRIENLGPHTLTDTYNTSYLGGRDQKDCSFRSTQAKSYQDAISENKLGIVVHRLTAMQAEYVGELQSGANPGEKVRLRLKK
jgi:hypothetical protein